MNDRYFLSGDYSSLETKDVIAAYKLIVINQLVEVQDTEELIAESGTSERFAGFMNMVEDAAYEFVKNYGEPSSMPKRETDETDNVLSEIVDKPRQALRAVA